MADRAFSDEELTSYLDGEADRRLEEAISAALESGDQMLSAQIAALDAPIAIIREGYDALLTEAPPVPSLAPPTTPSQIWPRAGFFGVGLAAGLAVAVVGGLFQTPDAPAPGWKATVAQYQMLYGSDTLAEVSPTPDARLSELTQVASAIGVDLSDLPELPGLTFRRAQVLDFRGRPLAQIAYSRGDGTPVALCIIKGSSPPDTLVQAEEIAGLGAVSWNAAGFGYLLIGGEDAESLLSEAQPFATWSQSVL